MPRRCTLALTLLAACAGGDRPAADPGAGAMPAPEAAPPAPGGGGSPAPPAGLDPAFVAAIDDYARALDAAIAACIPPTVGKVTPAAAEAAPFPFTADDVRTACADAFTVFDRLAPPLLGRSREATVVLEAGGRLGDDLDYLLRTIGQDGAERRNAVEHIEGALRDGENARALWARSRNTYRMSLQGDLGEAIRRGLHNDGIDVEAGKRSLGNLVFNQGLDPAMVRRRMLSVRGAHLLAIARARAEATAAAGLQGEELAAQRAYDEALMAYATMVDETWRQFTAGVTLAQRQAAVARADAAYAGWVAARDALAARHPGPPVTP